MGGCFVYFIASYCVFNFLVLPLSIGTLQVTVSYKQFLFSLVVSSHNISQLLLAEGSSRKPCACLCPNMVLKIFKIVCVRPVLQSLSGK